MPDRGRTQQKEADRSPEEIRVDIERTRSHLDDTVEQIGHKLSPGRFVDDLWARVQSEGASAVTQSLRQHPIPFTLVGAGLGWLVYEQAKGRPARGRAEEEVGTYYEPDFDGERAGSKVKERVAGAAHAATEKISATASNVTENISDTASKVKGSISKGAGTATREVKHGAERARAGFGHMLESNPMAVGAIAFGVGMASGLSAPRTKWEDERLGRFSRPVKEELADAAEKAKTVAQGAFDAARDQVQQEKEELMHGDPLRQVVDEVKQSAKEVGAAAKEAAREKSVAENLTPEGMKERARHVRTRARGES